MKLILLISICNFPETTTQQKVAKAKETILTNVSNYYSNINLIHHLIILRACIKVC